MDIRKKTVIIVGITLFLLIFALYASSEIIINEGFSRVETLSAQKDMDRAVVALGNDINWLDALADEWASRNDTRRYIEENSGDGKWPLLDADLFERLYVNVILLFNDSGDPIAGQAYDLTDHTIVPVPQGLHSAVSEYAIPEEAPGSIFRGTMGVVQLPEGPMMIAIHPVFRESDDKVLTGYFLIGRYLDRQEIARISSLTQLDLEAYSYYDPSMPPDFIRSASAFTHSPVPFIQRRENEVVEFHTQKITEPVNTTMLMSYSLIRDISGSPAVILRAALPRDIYSQGKSTSMFFFIMLCASGLIIALIMLLLLEKTVLSRIALLSDRVNDIGRNRDFSARVAIRGQDEIGSLAGNVNGMLGDLEQSQNILQDRLILSEERYRLFFNSISDPVIICRFSKDGMAGTIFESNDAALQVLGYTRAELLALSPSALFPAETGEHLHGIEGGNLQEKSARFESVLTKKNGDEIAVEVIARAFDQFVYNAVLTISRDITDRNRADKAIRQAQKKLSLLNFVTFNDIQNASFAIDGYLGLRKRIAGEARAIGYLEKEEDALRRITAALTFAQQYQDLGTKPPQWQNVNHAFILAISHLDFSRITRDVKLDELEIFADPLLELVFFHIAENVLVHGKTATKITIGYSTTADGLTIMIEDNGAGIPEEQKEKIFTRSSVAHSAMGLFLAKEILEITGITIAETGTFGKGARFEIRVPQKMFRFGDNRTGP